MTIRISSLFLLVVGALWVWWLSALSARATDPQRKNQKCRDVLPWLRTALYLLTWVLVLLLLCSGIAIMVTDRGGAGEKTEGLVMLGVVVALCVFQLRHIHAVRFSDRTVEEDCAQVARSRHVALTVVAGVFMLAGGIGLIDGASTADADANSPTPATTAPGRRRSGRRSSRGRRAQGGRS